MTWLWLLISKEDFLDAGHSTCIKGDFAVSSRNVDTFPKKENLNREVMR